MADGLLNKASIILTPTGYKAGTLYNVAPIDEPYEDFDFARTSTATRINSSGLVSNVATGVPRINYDSNGDNGHILLEPTSTNLIPYSEDFGEWLIFNTITRTSNYGISPDGTQNSYKIGSSGGVNDFIYLSLTITASQSHTLSFFIKNVDSTQTKFFNPLQSTININWSGSTITYIDSGANYEAYGDGWYKITTTATSTSSGGFITRFYPSTSGTASVELYGYQLEELSYATSYIPTLTGSQEVRETETATGAGSADLINSTEGVLYAEIARAENDTNAGIISLNDGSNSNVVSIYYFSNDKIAFDVFSSSPPLSQSVTTSNTSNFNKIALKYKSGDIALWVNGVEVITRTETISLSGLNNLDFRYGNNTFNFYGKCKALAVFNEALSDSELTQLTT